MERHVYRPPRGSPKLNLFLALLGGAFMTFAVFYVIPLMKKLEGMRERTKVAEVEEIGFEEAPEEYESPEEEPPPEEEEEPPPELQEMDSELDLSLDLPDLAVGIGSGPLLDIKPEFDIRDSGDNFLNSGDLDQPPKATSRTPPRYPQRMRQRGTEGVVVVRAMVDENGVVGDVTVKESSGSPELDRAAMNAIKRWRYKPAIKGGRKVRAPIVQRISFKLQK